MKTKDQRWRSLPMTQKQADLMDAYDIPYDGNTTRGEASDAITEYEDFAPHPYSEEAFNP